uniref:Dynein heavy chain coiled coil stalk domain-containing protein n=1 Tax=Timema poppense TaxID=170557 RepID=A0A7R9HD68_TIMPO|nr:unnamed protein product [Timema poppensis]
MVVLSGLDKLLVALTGLDKLQSTGEEVQQLQKELTAMKPDLELAAQEAAKMITRIDKDKETVEGGWGNNLVKETVERGWGNNLVKETVEGGWGNNLVKETVEGGWGNNLVKETVERGWGNNLVKETVEGGWGNNLVKETVEGGWGNNLVKETVEGGWGNNLVKETVEGGWGNNLVVAEETKIVVEKEEAEATKQAETTQAIAADAQKDLDEAMPMLLAAETSLRALNKGDITEVRALKRPPLGVHLVMEAICIVKDVKPLKNMTLASFILVPHPSGNYAAWTAVSRGFPLGD